jgi:hypothetical protein
MRRLCPVVWSEHYIYRPQWSLLNEMLSCPFKVARQ